MRAALAILRNRSLTGLLLRASLATVFLYAAISSFKNPNNWIAFLPTVLTNSFSATMLLKIFSAYELFLVLWLVSGRYVRYAGLLCALTLGGIIVSNVHAFELTFRDLGLLLAALALACYREPARR